MKAVFMSFLFLPVSVFASLNVENVQKPTSVSASVREAVVALEKASGRRINPNEVALLAASEREGQMRTQMASGANDHMSTVFLYCIGIKGGLSAGVSARLCYGNGRIHKVTTVGLFTGGFALSAGTIIVTVPEGDSITGRYGRTSGSFGGVGAEGAIVGGLEFAHVRKNSGGYAVIIGLLGGFEGGVPMFEMSIQ